MKPRISAAIKANVVCKNCETIFTHDIPKPRIMIDRIGVTVISMLLIIASSQSHSRLDSFAAWGVVIWLFWLVKRKHNVPKCPACKSRVSVPANSPVGKRIVGI
jgi:DNA-directed RNA polymerase subunit RPC12/RpoP